MTPPPRILAGLAAVVLCGCSLHGGDADDAGRKVQEDYEAGLNESAAEERPARPADFVPRPVIGRPEARPLRVEPVSGVELTLKQCVEYLLPAGKRKSSSRTRRIETRQWTKPGGFAFPAGPSHSSFRHCRTVGTWTCPHRMSV